MWKKIHKQTVHNISNVGNYKISKDVITKLQKNDSTTPVMLKNTVNMQSVADI